MFFRVKGFKHAHEIKSEKVMKKTRSETPQRETPGYQYLALPFPPLASARRPGCVFFPCCWAPPSSPSPLSPLPLSGLFLSPLATHEPLNADVLPCRAGQNWLSQTNRPRPIRDTLAARR